MTTSHTRPDAANRPEAFSPRRFWLTVATLYAVAAVFIASTLCACGGGGCDEIDAAASAASEPAMRIGTPNCTASGACL